jgi:pyruvate,water dikinase
MIPFPRTVDEAKKVNKTMASFGLKQGKHGLKVM